MTKVKASTTKVINPVEVLVNDELKAMTREELESAVKEYENLLLHLEEKISKVTVKPEGRKSQVLAILKSGHVTVDAIGQRIGISARNVSSQLSYLRKDGYAIATDSLGRKFLESTAPATASLAVPKEKSILRKA